MAKIKCPADNCPVKIEENDLITQSQHMTTCHPEIVDQRRRSAGFRQDAHGKWIDTLAPPPSPR